ncbi:DNA repair protein RecN [Bengtsoniella intestinalis]|uniref:DNA repair protein RecN n=1 Tax=Bengtsoniella intestinalis TaxID=3073143 RepID=UPI00391FAD94
MLELLHIEQIALIEQADIRFHVGFNALTGETGAGKSIIIDAMGAVLGGRTSRELIRTGANRAFVSGLFSHVNPTLPALVEQGIVPDENGELLLQRELTIDGKNTCRINGRPVSVSQLRQVGQDLLNIHGQHDGQQLMDETLHGVYLDRFGNIQQPLFAYQTAFESYQALQSQIKSLQMDEAEKIRKMDSLRFQIKEIERAELQDGEEEELLARRNLLRNGEKYLTALSGADYAMGGDDESMGAVALMKQALQALAPIRNLSEDLGKLYAQLSQVQSDAYDLAEWIGDQRSAFEFSPAELDAVESRSDLIYRLEKKYGNTIAEILQYLDKCRKELDDIQTADDTLVRLQGKLAKAEKAVVEAGGVLTKARQSAAKELEVRILQELRDLDMHKIQFVIEFTSKAPAIDGCDTIRFLMSANAGEAVKPIAKVASGGELARIMLGLKNVLAEQEAIATMVFDEVDTGVSGRAAQKVAQKLAQVSRHKQVLCVTHLPQLAAMADVHFAVTKGEVKGRTFTELLELDRSKRMAELARISGGDVISEALLQSAGELLDSATTYRNGLEG